MEKLAISDLENNAAYQNIISRTSIRRFADREVDGALKEAVVRAGMSAPSGVNMQPWEFVLIDDADILQALADALPYAKMTAAAPFAVAVCGNESRFLEGEDSTLWVQDVSAASENILLAAHALGLGAVWTCLYPHTDRMKAACDILSLPEGIIPFSLIPVGYPEKEHAPICKWHPERMHRNRF